MLDKLKPGLNPISISTSCDFEQTIIKSNKTNYPNAEVKG